MGFPSFRLTDRVAVVVGAGRGIGRTLALGLADAGAHVVVSSRTLGELESLADEIRAMGCRALVVTADVTKISDVQALADATLAEFGRVDILVNNAGMNINEPVLDVTEEHWDRILDTNLKGLFFCCQVFGRVMVEQRQGKIVNVGSTFGLVGYEQRSAYAASKGGVTQLTKVLAIEWAPHNVNVNAIAPTATHTPMNAALFADPEWRAEVLRRIPMGRYCEPEDLVGAVVFLSSDASDLVTGVTLPIDGGWTAW
jgi:NAD(P)-dependent dehydrogenase (short-subunit alcohol dehydrogenase family)